MNPNRSQYYPRKSASICGLGFGFFPIRVNSRLACLGLGEALRLWLTKVLCR
jgi:hypothetical protein